MCSPSIRHFQDAYVKAGVSQAAAIVKNIATISTGVYDYGTGTMENVN